LRPAASRCGHGIGSERNLRILQIRILQPLDALPMNGFYLFDASWLFFAAWSAAVIFVGIKAFGRDFFPPKSVAGSDVAKRPSALGR